MERRYRIFYQLMRVELRDEHACIMSLMHMYVAPLPYVQLICV